MQKKRFQLLFFIVICLSVGGFASLATRSSLTQWYPELQKPLFHPPNWIFAPVWTFLYLLIAIAGWRIWDINTSLRARLRVLFVTQLLMNGLWSFLFFGLRNPAIGLAGILLLWGCIFVLIRNALRSEKTAGLLLIPYLAWVSFAVYLNAALWWLNR